MVEATPVVNTAFTTLWLTGSPGGGRRAVANPAAAAAKRAHEEHADGHAWSPSCEAEKVFALQGHHVSPEDVAQHAAQAQSRAIMLESSR